MQEILSSGIWTIQCTAICTWSTVTRLRVIPLLAKCPDRVNYPDCHRTSEDHAAWIINLQTVRLAPGVWRLALGVSVVHHKPNTCTVVFIQQELSTVLGHFDAWLCFTKTDVPSVWMERFWWNKDHFSFKKISYHIHYGTVTDEGQKYGCAFFVTPSIVVALQ
jgi:hypothetical protein